MDTRLLEHMWRGMDAKVVDILQSTFEEVEEAIGEEEDTLLICGHGSPRGLLHPFKGYAVTDGMLRRNLRARNLICIWCHASDFGRTYGYKGFFSSMFISDALEAEYEGIKGYSDRQIWKSEDKFCNQVNELLKMGIPLKEWKDILMENYNPNNKVEDFNYKGLVYLW